MINYLFSAISNDGFNENQGKYLKKDIKNNSKIVFISSVADAYEKNDLFSLNILVGYELCMLVYLCFRIVLCLDRNHPTASFASIIRPDCIYSFCFCPHSFYNRSYLFNNNIWFLVQACYLNRKWTRTWFYFQKKDQERRYNRYRPCHGIRHKNTRVNI